MEKKLIDLNYFITVLATNWANTLVFRPLWLHDCFQFSLLVRRRIIFTREEKNYVFH